MAQKPAWQRYLEGESSSSKSPFSIADVRVKTAPLTPILAPGADPELEKKKREDERATLAAQTLGVAETGKPDTGFITSALRTITYPFAVLFAGAKEFAVDPAVRVFQEIDRYKAKMMSPQELAKYEAKWGKLAPEEEDLEKVWNVREFLDSVNNRAFFTDAYKEELESVKKLPGGRVISPVVGFAGDIVSTGGLGTGVRAAGTLGRKAQARNIEGAASDVFKKKAAKLADETDEAFALRASEFGQRAALAQLEGRSGAVARLFERELGEAAGKAAFQQLPKEIKGGLQIMVAGDTLANLNAGGYATRAVANALGISALPKTTDWAVKSFQGLRNSLRADEIKTPVLRNVVGRINKILNNVGQESAAWQSFVRASVSKANEEDTLNAYKGFSQGVDALNNIRNTRMEFVQSTKDFLADLSRLKPRTVLGKELPGGDAAAYLTARKLMEDPEAAKSFVPKTASDEKALKVFEDYRNEYDRYHKLLTSYGFDVGYLDDYLPLLYARSAKDADDIAKVLTAGTKNIPGAGYRPEVARTKFMKTTTDPVTGVEKQIPMSPREIKDYFISIGRKDLADTIETDPEVLLARYATNVSRLLANKAFVDDMLKKGVLQRSSLPQLDVQAQDIEAIVATLNPAQIKRVTADFAGTEGGLSKYIETINDEFVQSVRLNDPALRNAADAKVEKLVQSLADVRDVLSKRLSATGKKYSASEEAQDAEAMLEIKPLIDRLRSERDLLTRQMAMLRARNTPEANKLADELADRSNNGVEYLQVGGDIGVTYNLPKELAELHGERALVEAINRRLLLQTGKAPKELTDDFEKAFDATLQFWRTGATFGRLFGFVARNLVGAVQNNILILKATGADHTAGSYITRSDIITDRALLPYTQLTRKDVSAKRLDRMAAKGNLTDEQIKLLRDDIENYGFVKSTTISSVKRDVLKGILEKKKLQDSDVTYWDVYEASVKGKVFDRYTILPSMQTKNAEDDAAYEMLNIDPDRIALRTDRIDAERGWFQKTGEGILNFGATIPADIAGRNVRIKPIQLTRDANERAEQFARTSAIAAGLRQYGKEEGGVNSAILGMKAAQFDYSNLTELERRWFRRVMPFYTWSRNNVPAQVRVLFNDPARVQRNLAFWEAVKNVFADEEGNAYIVPDYVSEMYGFVLDDDIKKQLLKDKPQWLQDIMKYPLGVATSQLSPVTELERWTKGFGQGVNLENETINQTLTSNPISKAAIQYITKKNLFTGSDYKDKVAPEWFVSLSKILGKTGVDLGVYTDDKTGESMVNERVLEQIRTLLPIVSTGERIGLGVLDIGLETITGKPSNLSGSEDYKTIQTLISTISGLTTTSITPDVERGVLQSRINNKNEAIRRIAGDRGVSREKLNKLIKNLQDAGYTNEQILYAVEQARKSGQLAADYLSATE